MTIPSGFEPRCWRETCGEATALLQGLLSDRLSPLIIKHLIGDQGLGALSEVLSRFAGQSSESSEPSSWDFVGSTYVRVMGTSSSRTCSSRPTPPRM